MESNLAEPARRIESALAHIHANPDADLSLDALARRAHWSPFHFHRVFRAFVGVPLHQYVRDHRIQRGREILASGEARVRDVARTVGYGSPEGLARALRTEPSAARAGWGSPGQRDGVHAPRSHRLEFGPERRIAFVRHEGRPAGIGLAWWRLMSWAGKNGLLRGKPERFGMLHADPDSCTPPRVVYDACVVVPPETAVRPPIGSGVVEPREWFVAGHDGPMHALARTFDWCILTGIPGAGRRLVESPCLIKVLNWSPWTPQRRWRSEVFLPVEARP